MQRVQIGSKVRLHNRFGWHKVVAITDKFIQTDKEKPNMLIDRKRIASVSNREARPEDANRKCLCKPSEHCYHALADFFCIPVKANKR